MQDTDPKPPSIASSFRAKQNRPPADDLAESRNLLFTKFRASIRSLAGLRSEAVVKAGSSTALRPRVDDATSLGMTLGEIFGTDSPLHWPGLPESTRI